MAGVIYTANSMNHSTDDLKNNKNVATTFSQCYINVTMATFKQRCDNVVCLLGSAWKTPLNMRRLHCHDPYK